MDGLREVPMIVDCASCGARVRVPESRLGESSRCARCKAAITPLSKPVSVGSEQEFDALVRDSSLPVVVDFWAPWCGPCRVVAPELEKLARARQGRAIVAKVNTDELPSLGRRFAIASIPTVAVFERGRERHRVSGAMPAEQLARALEV